MSSESNITDFRVQPDFVIISTSGLSSGFVNFACLIYLLVRILTRWWVTEKSLPMVHRVPLYLTISELMLFVINLVNMGYTTIHGHTIEGVACKVVGGLSFFTVSSNVTLVGLLSLMTYLRVRRKYIIDMGIYDYKLFLILFTISLTLTLIGVQDYGPSKFWCYNSPTDPIRPLITIGLIFLILFITLFCYVMTLMEINIQQNMIRNFGSDNVTFSRVDIIVVRKIIAYILIFLLEWAPTVIYFITQMFQYENVWIYTVSVVFINLGGIGNAILYISYESWKNNYDNGTTFVASNSSNSGGISKNNQESHHQITVHNVSTIEKGFRNSSSSDQEL
ncbi:1099_t:CDS:2 [Cetraspora pellucida]|uniref:1099_t:CDS:1 n=1 Tax=Cetraspora pellucida TaxID=1433469 RepID=A0A9N9F2B3_9GLOM|nr:1099_t:CDS:2 [Cetraspora pellucida]